MRNAAAVALGQLDDPKAEGALVNSLRDEDAGVRAAASHSLEQLDWQPGSDSQRVLQFLATGNLRRVVALGAAAVGPLVDMMLNGPPNKQFAAVKALGEINDPRVLQAMLDALRMSNPAVRIAALETLERIAEPSVLPNVERLLKDHNPSVRAAAVEAASRCGGPRAVPALVQTLKDASWEVRQVAVRALGMLGDASAVEDLCKLVQDPDRDVRESAIVALGQICDQRAIYPLVLKLLDPESSVRAAAAAALRNVNRCWEQTEDVRRALPEIKAALNHQEYWVRHCATILLEQLQVAQKTPVTDTGAIMLEQPVENSTHPALPILADLLADRDRDLRLAAAETLGRLFERRAVPLLAQAVQDSDRWVRQAAQSALTALN